MAVAKRIVAVFAHPDDETFVCGGTLAKYAKEGASITLLCATKGEMGRRMGTPPFANRETMPKLREGELREACRLLGIQDLRFLGIRDKLVECENAESLTLRIMEVIRERKPQVVLTFHERIGGHPDHCAIGRATTLACQRVRDELPEMRLFFITYGETMKKPEPYGFHKEQISVIDIGAHRKTKMLAFRAHRSQTEMDKSLWRPDDKVIQRFGTAEYFIQGSTPFVPGETDLFSHLRRF
jgi:bacillithiol biosynthesis deacetylase BshB2